MVALDTTPPQPCPTAAFPPRQPNRTGPPHTQSPLSRELQVEALNSPPPHDGLPFLLQTSFDDRRREGPGVGPVGQLNMRVTEKGESGSPRLNSSAHRNNFSIRNSRVTKIRLNCEMRSCSCRCCSFTGT